MNRLSTFLCIALTLPVLAAARDLKLVTSDLSNGAILSVDVLNPRANESFVLAPGEQIMKNVTIEGSAHINLGKKAEVAYIFVIDSSGSTSDYDGACGTTLDCVQKFFGALYNETVRDGSAKFIGVVDFDDSAKITAQLQDPSNPAIVDAIYKSSSGGNTECSDALTKAASMVVQANNTAKETIVVFAGDGKCDNTPTLGASTLQASGAKVHSIAVGDMVDCTVSSYNDLDDIPQNGGKCFSIRDPNDLPDIVDDILPVDTSGSTLRSVEVKVDQANYQPLTGFELTKDLPEAGAVSVQFRKEVNDLTVGSHKACVRAFGSDVVGDSAQVENCVDFEIQAAPTMAPTLPPTFATPAPTVEPEPMMKSFIAGDSDLETWQIVLIVIAALALVIGLISFLFYLACAKDKEAPVVTVEEDLKMEETTTKQELV